VHATILTLSADTPLVTAQQTPLEINSAAFLLSMAHQADLTIGIRTLDTGAARDVSGVLRISIGDNDEDDEEAKEELLGKEERELLYYVGQDGGVKVFERGQ
jgi:elongator complex protein 6